MLWLSLVSSSFQLNGVFQQKDMRKLIDARLERPKSCIIFGQHVDIRETESTEKGIPDIVILSVRSCKLHFFWYDSMNITRCIWDGKVSQTEKTEIVKNMLRWLHNKRSDNISYFLFGEDAKVFSVALDNRHEHVNKTVDV